MSSAAQTHATNAYRKRPRERGLARLEIRAADQDKELLRRLAATLAADDARSKRVRDAVNAALAPPSRGGVLAALRRAPLVGVDLDITREDAPPRDLDL